MTDAQRRRRHGILVAVATTLLGPAIGSLLFLVTVLVRGAVGEGFVVITFDILQSMASVAMFVTVFAYVTAGFPALLCGVYLGWYTVSHGGFSRSRAVAAAAVASVAGLAMLDVLMRFSADPNGSGGSLMPLLVIVLPVAMLTALLGQILSARFGVNATQS